MKAFESLVIEYTCKASVAVLAIGTAYFIAAIV